MIIDQLSKDKLFYNLMKWNEIFQIQRNYYTYLRMYR